MIANAFYWPVMIRCAQGRTCIQSISIKTNARSGLLTPRQYFSLALLWNAIRLRMMMLLCLCVLCCVVCRSSISQLATLIYPSVFVSLTFRSYDSFTNRARTDFCILSGPAISSLHYQHLGILAHTQTIASIFRISDNHD